MTELNAVKLLQIGLQCGMPRGCAVEQNYELGTEERRSMKMELNAHEDATHLPPADCTDLYPFELKLMPR